MSYIGNNPRLKSIVSNGDTLANLTLEPRVAGRLVYATDEQKFYWDDGSALNEVGAGGFNAVQPKAVLDALAREQGKIYYATDEDVVYTDDGTQLNALAGGGGIPNLAKGSLVTSDGSNNGELTVGTDGQALVADSAEVAGLKWFDIIPTTGTTGQVLTKTATGYEWQDASGGGMQIITTRRQSVTVLNTTSYTIPANTYGICRAQLGNNLADQQPDCSFPAGTLVQVTNFTTSSLQADGIVVYSGSGGASTQYLYVTVIGN